MLRKRADSLKKIYIWHMIGITFITLMNEIKRYSTTGIFISADVFEIFEV